MGIMDLHRSGAKADWDLTPQADWNEYQWRAAQTMGFDTPGNRATALGAVFSLAGIAAMTSENPWKNLLGVGLLGIGRYYDLVDGKRAAETGTKSPLGEAIDAGVDGVLMAMAALAMRRQQMISSKEASLVRDLTVAKVLGSGIGKLRDKAIHPETVGKDGTFAVWCGIGLTAIGRTVENFGNADTGHSLAKSGGVFRGLGERMIQAAAHGYLREALS